MKKPTLHQVTTYFVEAGSTPEAAKLFFDRYEANGWTVNKLPTAETNWQTTRKPMRNWKRAAVGTIERANIVRHNRTKSKLSAYPY